jgi:hypothetical protein
MGKVKYVRAQIAAVPRVLGSITQASQAWLLAWEEGVLVHESLGALTNGQAFMDLIFRAKTGVARDPGTPEGWGIQEAHVKRLLLLNRPPERSGSPSRKARAGTPRRRLPREKLPRRGSRI